MSNGSDDLRDALRALSVETRDAGAGLPVKANLVNEIRSRRRKALVRKWWPAVAVAALVMGVWLGLPKGRVLLTPQGTATPTEVVSVAPALAEEPQPMPVQPPARRAKWAAPHALQQLRPLTPWYIHPGIPQARQGHMVYMEVGPETARLFGLVAAGPMQAEVFLGDDGLARAIRLVRTTQIAKGE